MELLKLSRVFGALKVLKSFMSFQEFLNISPASEAFKFTPHSWKSFVNCVSDTMIGKMFERNPSPSIPRAFHQNVFRRLRLPRIQNHPPKLFHFLLGIL